MNKNLDMTLSLIIDPYMQRLTRRMLQKAPSYMDDMALSERKSYPLLEEDTRPGGLWLHSAKTARIAYRIFSRLGCNSDIGVIAGLLHHVSEKGYVDEGDNALGAFDKLHYDIIHLNTRGYDNINFTLEKGSPEHGRFFAKWFSALHCIRFQEGSEGRAWRSLSQDGHLSYVSTTEVAAFVSAEVAARACLWENLLIT